MNAPIKKLEGVPVVWRDRPFNGRVHRMVLRPGDRMPTVAEIVARAEGLPNDFYRNGQVRINGIEVPRGCWHLVRPRLDPDVPVAVTLHAPLLGGGGGGSGGGGGGGSKNVIATVALIAVVLATAAISAGALAPLGAAFTAGGIGANIAAAAVGKGGKLGNVAN